MAQKSRFLQGFGFNLGTETHLCDGTWLQKYCHHFAKTGSGQANMGEVEEQHVSAGIPSEDVLVQVRKLLPLLRCHFMMLNSPSVYQDRLGTNKHKESWENSDAFSYRISPATTPGVVASPSARRCPAAFGTYAKTVVFNAIYISMRSFYQDRLGTHIGKALKKRDLCVFLR